MSNYSITVTSAFGIEGVTKRELKKLGVEANAENYRFTFDGNENTIARCNMFLRTAERVFINLKSFVATSFDELFDGIYSIDLAHYFTKDANIIVNAKSNNSKLFALSAIQSITKKAIVTKMCEKFKINSLSESGSRYKVEISIVNDLVVVQLDTSGAGLHKRGYRTLGSDAPLKETLAAALIDLSVWNSDRPLVDCFCGSGTIPIEASLAGLNIASGLNREFDFDKWTNFETSAYFNAKKEAEEIIIRDKKLSIWGYDISESAISQSMFHAKNAGVEGQIHFQRMDFRNLSSAKKNGVLIVNPPYGERLGADKEIVKIYTDLKATFDSLDNWCLYLITSYVEFERLFRKKADRTRNLYNGNLKCCYFQYLGEKPQRNKFTIG